MKKLMLAALLAAVMIWVAGCGASTVATVNGVDITSDDLERAMKETRASMKNEGFPEEGTDEFRELERRNVERLVNEEVLWAEAEKMGITVSDDEINEQVDKFAKQVGEDQLETVLAEQGLTQADFREQQRKALLFQKLYPEVTKDTPKVTDAEAQKYFLENPAQFEKPERRKVRHILFKEEQAAIAVKARLDAGEDFATVAREVSEDPGSKDKGGELGEAASQNSGFVPEFEQAMNQLAVGQISGPVKSELPGFGTGYHIIQVTEIKPPGMPAFDEVKEEIKQQLEFNVNQRNTFEKWFEAAKAGYDITYADGYEPAPTTPAATGTQTATTAQPAPATQPAP